MSSIYRSRRFHGLCLLVIGAAPVHLACAAETPAGVCHTVDGREISGHISRLDNDVIEIRRDNGTIVSTPRTDALRLDLDTSAPGEPTPQPWLLFAGGDRIAAIAQGIAGDQIIARWTRFPDRQPLRVPIERLRGVIIQPPEFPRDFERLLNTVFTSSFNADTFFLTGEGGGRLAGELADSRDAAWTLETSVGPVAVDSERISALAFNSSLILESQRSGAACLVVFRDGSWITFETLTLEDSGSAARLTFYGEELDVPAGDMQSIEFFGPRLRPLDEVEPDRISADFYLGDRPGLRINRNARGGFLTLRGREHPRGFGMVSGVSVTWKLTAEDRRFQATIGIDDCAAGGGSVRFIVELDGRPVYTSDLLRGSDAPVNVGPLVVAGAEELTLRVDYGEYGDIQDFADWCSPLLLQ